MSATRSPKAQRCIVEALEPKLLYSADITPAAFLPEPASALVSTQSATTVQMSSNALQQPGTEMVFIDTSINDSASLIHDLQQQAQRGRAIEVILIDPKEDGIARITEALSQRQDVSAIHLISHGVTGQVQLGTAALNMDNLLTRAAEVAQWGQSLTANADLLIYGCDVAASAEGMALVNGLAHLTGADVAASTDDTGSKALGGDWQLEVTSSGGSIEAPLAPSLAEQDSWQHVLANSVNVAENSTYVTRVPSQFLINAYSLDSSFQDNNMFSINSAGDISFNSAPDYETPRDANGDNVYMVKASVWGGGLLFTSVVYQVTVTNVDEAPVITTNNSTASVVAVSVSESTSGGFFYPVTNISIRDPEGSSVSSTSLSGTDASRFALISNTLYFIWAPNYEAPSDSGSDNQYQLIIQATDQTSHTRTQAIIVDVTNVNEAPRLTSNASVSVQENTTHVSTLTGSDPDANTTLSYGISGGSDAALFIVNPTTGSLDFRQSQDYEARADFNHDNIFNVQVSVSDGQYVNTQDMSVSLLNVNEFPPVISSGGGGASAIISVDENTSRVATVTATDQDANTNISYTIVSGGDSALFTINSSTGVLSFRAAPNFEAPADQGADNLYQVTVRASDNMGMTDTQDLTVAIANVNEAPWLVGGPTTTLTVGQGQTYITTVVGSDVDAGSTLTYTPIGGADRALFAPTMSNGALAFLAPHYPSQKVDANGDGIYEVIVQVSDGQLTAQQSISVVVILVNDPPVISSSPTASVDENSVLAASIQAQDPEGGSLTYAIDSGADSAKFYFETGSNQLRFITAPDFEHPGSAAGNNSYNVVISVSDGTNTTLQPLTIVVADANDAPLGGPDGNTSAIEDTPLQSATSLLDTAFDEDQPANTLTAVLARQAAHGTVLINADGTYTYTPQQDFNGQDDFVYVVNDGVADSQSVTVTLQIIPANDAPVAQDASVGTEEDQPIVVSIPATDVDGDALSTTIVTQPLHGLLEFDADGRLTYTPSPGYDGLDSFTFTSSDGALVSNQGLISITVSPVNDAPTAIITRANYVIDEQTALSLQGTGLSISDPDADTSAVEVTLSVSNGTLTGTPGTTGVTIANSGTQSITLTGLVAQINALLDGTANGTLTYLNNSDTPTPDTLVMSIDDLGNGGAGGAMTDSAQVTININALNDAPTVSIIQTSYLADEQTPLPLQGTGLSIADPDADVSDVQVTLSVSNGTLTGVSGTTGVTIANSGTQSITLTGLVAQINALLDGTANGTLTYLSNSDAPTPDTLVLSMDDLANGGGGSAMTASAQVSIDINALNDAPSVNITQTSYLADEQTPLSLQGTGLSIADPDAATSTVQLSLSVGTGTLSVTAGSSGVAVANSGIHSITLTGTVAQINALLDGSANGTLTYLDERDAPTPDTLVLSMDDLANGGSGGAMTASAQVTIDINALNDAPSVSIIRTSYLTDEQTPLPLQGTGLSIADPDASTSTVQLTLSVGAGTLSGTAGASGVAIANSGTHSITLTGTVAQINALLDGSAAGTISYLNDSDTPTPDTLVLSMDDLANGRTGGALSANAQTAINITPIDDAPVITTNSLTIGRGGTATPDLAITDVDTSAADVHITASLVSGGHFLNTQTVADVLSFTLADYQAGIIKFVHDGSFNPPTYQLHINDGHSVVTAPSPSVMFQVGLIITPTPSTNTSTSAESDEATPPSSSTPSTPPGDSAEAAPLPLLGALASPGSTEDLSTPLPLFEHTIDMGGLGATSSGWSVAASSLTFRINTDARVLRDWRTELTALNADMPSGGYNWAAFLQSGDAPETLRRNLDSLRNQLMGQEEGRHQVIASTIAMSTGLSVGYVIWLVRGGALLGSMLSTMPMWQMIDPLPVLTRSAGGRRHDSDEPADDASVEQIFDGEQHEPPPPPPQGDASQKLTPEATP